VERRRQQPLWLLRPPRQQLGRRASKLSDFSYVDVKGSFYRPSLTSLCVTGFARPATPPSGTSTPQNEPADYHDQEGAHNASEQAYRKHGNYTSRVEQILFEQPEVQIVITHAGKNMEGGGSYIAYTIRLGVSRDVHSSCDYA